MADADLPDAGLIAQAWRRWGDRATQALLGDYAFAVFDGRDESLWLVRDAIGFRPLCFVADPAAVALSSLPSPLAGEGNARTDGAGLIGWPGVRQVGPGEQVRLRPGATSRSIWWQPSTAPSFTGDRQDLAAAMTEALDAAVADRVGADPMVACHLSAGLDSMAVATTLAHTVPVGTAIIAITAGPAPGHELIGPERRLMDETDHAAAVAALYPAMRHHVVEAGRRRILDDLMDAAALFEQPLTNPNNYGWFAESCAAATEAGASRLLMAQMGNFGLSAAARDHWWPLLRRDGARRAIHEWHRSAHRRGSLGELLRRLRQDGDRAAEQLLAVVRSIDPGLFLKGVERQGLLVLDPTADRRVLELGFTVPANLLVRDGDNRWVTRAMLRGRVPDAVLDEPRRGYQSADWPSRLRAEASELADLLDRAASLGLGSVEAGAAWLRGLAGRRLGMGDMALSGTVGSDLARAAFLLSRGSAVAGGGAARI